MALEISNDLSEARLDFAVSLTSQDYAELQRPAVGGEQFPKVPIEVYASWRMRPDLTKAFDISTARGYGGLVVWAARDGVHESARIRNAVDAAVGNFRGIVPNGKIGDDDALTWFALATWLARPLDELTFNPFSDDDRATVLNWFLDQGGVAAKALGTYTDEQLALCSRISPIRCAMPVVRLLRAIYDLRPDLQSAFDLQKVEGCVGFAVWAMKDGKNEYQIPDVIISVQQAAMLEWKNAQDAALSVAPAPVRPSNSRDDGDSGPRSNPHGSSVERRVNS